MKKVLLTSTALVMVAGAAAAEVSVSGSANAGLQFTEDAADELTLHYELDFGITGSGTSDSGLEFGASLDFDLDDSDVDGKDDLSDPEVFISGSFGTITVGAVDDASDNVGLGFSDVGFDGIGVDDNAETFIAAGEANVLYTYSLDSLTFAASADLADSEDTDSGDYAVGIAYGFGDFEVQLAYSSIDTGAAVVGDDADIIYVGFEGSAGSISYDIFYHQADGDTTDVAGYGASVDFVSGAITWTVAVGATDVDTDDTDFGVGMEYDLGGGLAFAAGIGSVGNLGDAVTKADAGFTMSF